MMTVLQTPVLSSKEFEEYLITVSSESTLSVEGDNVFPWNLADLYSLYLNVRINRVVAILEFGSGWSTLALTKALDENRSSFSRYIDANVRHPNAFTIMTVDCSEKFQELALKRIPSNLTNTRIIPVVSNARMTVLNGQYCHIFDALPPFTADFVYLDGPDCSQVLGSVGGFSVKFGSEDDFYGLPMAADMLLLEPFFWPGTILVTDGRGANASFLKNNFKRNWFYSYDKNLDQHVFKLLDAPFGSISDSLVRFKEGSPEVN